MQNKRNLGCAQPNGNAALMESLGGCYSLTAEGRYMAEGWSINEVAAVKTSHSYYPELGQFLRRQSGEAEDSTTVVGEAEYHRSRSLTLTPVSRRCLRQSMSPARETLKMSPLGILLTVAEEPKSK